MKPHVSVISLSQLSQVGSLSHCMTQTGWNAVFLQQECASKDSIVDLSFCVAEKIPLVSLSHIKKCQDKSSYILCLYWKVVFTSCNSLFSITHHIIPQQTTIVGHIIFSNHPRLVGRQIRLGDCENNNHNITTNTITSTLVFCPSFLSGACN